MDVASGVRANLGRGLLAAAVALAGCSDDAAGDGSGGNGASGGNGGASSAAQGGSGGATGATGGGSAVTELTIDSLESDVTLVNALPVTLTFLAHVSDPQGPADVAGGVMLQGAHDLGAFTAVDGAGAWQLVVTFQEGDVPNGFSHFLAHFEDLSGQVAESSVTVQVEAQGCVARPDAQSCRDCYCQDDPVGCAHYTEREYEFLYCGDSCSDACSAFCATHQAGTPDPSLIDGVCKACQPSFTDSEAFKDDCLADVPECFSFLIDVSYCG